MIQVVNSICCSHKRTRIRFPAPMLETHSCLVTLAPNLNTPFWLHQHILTHACMCTHSHTYSKNFQNILQMWIYQSWWYTLLNLSTQEIKAGWIALAYIRSSSLWKKYEYNYVKYTSIPNVKRHLNHITEPPCSTPYSIYSFQRNLEIMCTHFRLEIKRVFVGRS